MNVFTIVKVGWEYNDEYYYQSESGGGDPIIVYRDRENAEKECLKLNIGKYHGTANSPWNSIGAYFEDHNIPDTDKQSLEKLGVGFNNFDISLPKTQTVENWTLIISLIVIVFYKIEQLEFVE